MQTFYLGTSIQLSIITSIDAPNSVLVKIQNSSGTIVKEYTAATRVSDKVYTFVYQSDELGVEGEYIATVKVTYGANISIDKIKFIMEED